MIAIVNAPNGVIPNFSEKNLHTVLKPNRAPLSHFLVLFAQFTNNEKWQTHQNEKHTKYNKTDNARDK